MNRISSCFFLMNSLLLTGLLFYASAGLMTKVETNIVSETEISRNLQETEHISNEKQSASDYPHIRSSDFLDTNSVILITGAAGFLGSELAMALHRTYSPKQLILVDSIVDTLDDTADSPEKYHRIEYKRQRIFHVLQTVGNTARFFKCDLRPVIPEFFDVGEVPVLDNIFKQHPDITHVVHLANVRNSNKAVPRGNEDIRAGMMETLLEQLHKIHEHTNGERVPHFTYRSSYEVYSVKDGPLKEDDIIESPMSLYGTSKLMDEILASTYSNVQDIFSVGLRFFEVYGPWGIHNRVSEMARVIVENNNIYANKDVNQIVNDMFHKNEDLDLGKDFIYIDDAIDAIMSAMQYRPSIDSTTLHEKYPSVLFNVGSGQIHSFRQIAEYMLQLIQNVSSQRSNVVPNKPYFASTERANKYLGFYPQVTFEEGIKKVLAWNVDRSRPYGDGYSKESSVNNPEDIQTRKYPISSRFGLSTCKPDDTECSNGQAVFPCVSDCSHETTCFESVFDAVAPKTKALTEGCIAVLYTISLGDHVERIPSATVSVSPNSKQSIEINAGGKGICNLAFVSENSILYRKISLKQHGQQQGQFLTHGFWALVPIPGSFLHHSRDLFLPKLSPKIFFSSLVKYAVYADPHVIFNDLPSLLKEIEGKIWDNSEIVMVVPSLESTSVAQFSAGAEQSRSSVQERAYQMIHVGLTGNARKAYFSSAWIVHVLQDDLEDDAKLFRCDLYGETILWDVGKDNAAINFITEMHDFWVRNSMMWEGSSPWWVNDGAGTTDSQRRLQQQDSIGSKFAAENMNSVRWMGIMTSSSKNYFLKILPESEKVVYLNHKQ